MIKRIISVGVSEEQTNTMQQKIRMANIIAVLNGIVIGLPFTVISWFFYRPIAWIPLLGLLTCFVVLLFAYFEFTRLTRFIVMVSPLGLAFLYHIHLVDPGEPSISSMYLIQLAFSLLPFLVFDLEEYGYLIAGSVFVLICNLFFDQFANLISIDLENVEMLRSGILSKVLILMAVILGGSGIFVLSYFYKEAEDKTTRLVAEMDQQNRELKNSEEETRENLRKLEEANLEESKRKWVAEGLSKVNRLIRSNLDLTEFSYQLITEVVNYVNMNQGTIYFVHQDDEGPYLKRTATYAYDRRKYDEDIVRPGQGLLGQMYLEKDYIYLKEIPEEYLEITSGMGDAPPRYLLLLPMIFNEKIEGGFELASFKGVERYQIEFLMQVGEAIASYSNTFRVNEKTKELLQESQEQTEMLKSQEEEMRQNMEEMHATQEEMARTQKELSAKEANFKALIDNTTDSIIFIDKDYRIVLMNDTLQKRYQGTQYENIQEGEDVLKTLGDAAQEWKGYYDRALTGEELLFTIKSSVNGEDSWREYNINPVRDHEGGIVGVSVFSRDITDRVKAQSLSAKRGYVMDAMINNTDDTFFAIDASYRILVANEVLKSRFRGSDVELEEGTNILDLLPAEIKPKWQERYDRILSGEAFSLEEERPLEDKVLYTRINCQPIYGEGGEILGASVTSRDITEKKMLQEKLEKE